MTNSIIDSRLFLWKLFILKRFQIEIRKALKHGGKNVKNTKITHKSLLSLNYETVFALFHSSVEQK